MNNLQENGLKGINREENSKDYEEIEAEEEENGENDQIDEEFE